jgi:hypothetical protein
LSKSIGTHRVRKLDALGQQKIHKKFAVEEEQAVPEQEDDPFAGFGEKDRIRKPTKLTAAQIGIMALGTSIACLGGAVGVGALLVWQDTWRGAAAIAAGFGVGYSVYRTHWQYRRRD